MSDTPQDPTNPDDTPSPQEPQAPEEPTPAEAVGVGGQETPEGAHEISADEAASRTVTLVDPLDESEVDRITQIDLNHEMQRSYLDYAMSVIVSRALPDVRDGLKPVHRRIVYAMFDGGYRPDRSFSKCAKVVGEVMGNYHPHGDSAIYDAMVRLVQPWSMRYPLILGQGNFGSAGDDGAAAPRYTECKMAPLALELVRDIEQDTVDMKKFITTAAVVLTTAVAGILTWRKVESDRIRNDLWTEAERISAEQDEVAEAQPAHRA